MNAYIDILGNMVGDSSYYKNVTQIQNLKIIKTKKQENQFFIIEEFCMK